MVRFWRGVRSWLHFVEVKQRLGYIYARQEKIIFFLGAQPGDKMFLQTNGVFLC
jgi:hypothetical protein